MKPGEKIAILRHKKSYSVTDIAMKLDISSYEVMDWEDGKKPIPENLLYPLCSLLGISVTDFLDDSYVVGDDLVNHLDEESEEMSEDFGEEEFQEEAPTPMDTDEFLEEASRAFAPIEEKESFQEEVAEDENESFQEEFGKDEASEKIYRHYRRIVVGVNASFVIAIILFAIFIYLSVSHLIPGLSTPLFIFFFAYFIVLLFIVMISSGVKKYLYHGHRIVLFYMFFVNIAYVDGTKKKIKVLKGVRKGEAAMGNIDVGGEKLLWGAHKLYTPEGELIKPKDED